MLMGASPSGPVGLIAARHVVGEKRFVRENAPIPNQKEMDSRVSVTLRKPRSATARNAAIVIRKWMLAL